MKKYALLIFAVSLEFSTFLQSEIKVLFTAALIEANYEGRKNQYTKNLKLLKEYGCSVYVVESCVKGPTFLDNFCDHVIYTQSNNPHATISSNEANSMYIGMKQFQFDPEDMVIKVTGRYVLETNDFISLVKNNPEADIIARAWTPSDAYTGCFAIRSKYFEDLLENHYLNLITTPPYRGYAIEHGLGDYMTMRKHEINVMQWERIYDYLPLPCSWHPR